MEISWYKKALRDVNRRIETTTEDLHRLKEIRSNLQTSLVEVQQLQSDQSSSEDPPASS